MKSFRKTLAMIMATAVLATTVLPDNVLALNMPESTDSTEAQSELTTGDGTYTDASEPNTETGIVQGTKPSVSDTKKDEIGQTEDAEKIVGTEQIDDTEITDSSELLNSTELHGTEKPQDTEMIDGTEQVESTELESTELDSTETEELEDELEYLIQYLIVNQSKVLLGEKQQIVLGLYCEKNIEEAVLSYHNQETGESFEQYFTESIDNAFLFEMTFQNADQIGAYQLNSVRFRVEEEYYTEYFAEVGIEAVFGVNQEVLSNPDAVVDDGTSEETEGIDIDVVRIDENGDTISETSIEEALGYANAGQVAALSLDDEDAGISAYSVERSGNIVVVLDPGHDNTHAGAQANGLKEETLNLKIAAYCKEELEQYQGVTVYMVRALDGSCPYPGTTSGQCNEQRVAYAQSVGADIYVSIHNNSSSSTSAQGAEVYYPNSNYNSWIGTTGQGLAQVVEDHLVALGLYNRGIKIKDAQQDKYPDGSAADYYGVIRNSKLAGIPAIIIEHAFVTNSGDVNNFLNSDEKLKTLGVADATAIASYYGLSKVVDITVTSGTVQISNFDNSAGTALMSVSEVAPSDKIAKVAFSAWSQQGQSDLVWYEVANNGTGTYQGTLNISNHKYNTGTYHIDAYAFDIYGGSHYLGGNTCTFSSSASLLSVSGNSTQTHYTVSIENVIIPGGVKEVQFAVWSANGGMDDLVWYNVSGNTTGRYTANIPILNHKTVGTYYVDAYAVRMDGTSQYLTGTTFQVGDISAGSIEIKNIDHEKGQFDVVVDDISSASGIWQIEVPVWSTSDLSDLYWYIASRQLDGSYVAHVDIANHNYAYTKYNVDVYGVAGNGVRTYLGGKTATLNPPPASVTASGTADETTYTVSVTNLRMSGNSKSVKIAVWSAENGMDDLVWYDADETVLSEWWVKVPIKNHKTSGLYYADAYVMDSKGNSSYIGGTRFLVSGCSMSSIEIVNKDEGAGTFDVILKGVFSKSGISTVQIPVWSTSDLSDLHWYIAEARPDGTYRATVDIANHGYQYGNYNVDVYAISNTGIREYVGGTSTRVNLTNAVIKASGNTSETTYRATISNVGLPGGIKAISFAVWSQEGGQDDLKWYSATRTASGEWYADIPIFNHKTAGLYYADVYAVNTAGKSVYMGGTTFTTHGIDISGIAVTNKDEGLGRFDVKISGISSASGVYTVEVAVWSKSDLADLHWYTAASQADGSYVAQASITNHQYNYGKYYADVYVVAGNGIRQYVGGRTVDMNVPIAQVSAVGTTDQTRFSLTAQNVGIAGGVSSFRFAVWSQADGMDDLIWYDASNVLPGTWTADMNVYAHKTAGKYFVDAYAQSAGGNSIYMGGTTFTVGAPSVSAVELINYNEADGTFGVRASGVQSVSGIAKVEVAVWSASNLSDLLWYGATATGNGNYQVGADIRNHQNNTGTYYADVYITDNNGIRIYAGGVTCSMINVTNIYHPVMGSTSVTVKQMADYYRASAYYPSYYANTEAPTIEAFCKIYVEECQAEGVKAEVAFCQAMKETGFLKYGGNVSITQFNFAGMGSTGPGVAGECYPDVRTGIRAQVQHLKAYGCTGPLNQACVDTRFKYVARGTAPYVEWLGIKENPYGKGWATATNYGYDIVRMVNNLKTY